MFTSTLCRHAELPEGGFCPRCGAPAPSEVADSNVADRRPIRRGHRLLKPTTLIAASGLFMATFLISELIRLQPGGSSSSGSPVQSSLRRSPAGGARSRGSNPGLAGKPERGDPSAWLRETASPSERVIRIDESPERNAAQGAGQRSVPAAAAEAPQRGIAVGSDNALIDSPSNPPGLSSEREAGVEEIADGTMGSAAQSESISPDPNQAGSPSNVVAEISSVPPAPEAPAAAEPSGEPAIPEVQPASAPKDEPLDDGAPVVIVPAGDFLMGSNTSDERTDKDERPMHKVFLDTFFIDEHEVTNEQYGRFLESIRKKGHLRCDRGEPPRKNHAPDEHALYGLDFTTPLQPVVGVDWYDAVAYCGWAGKRLPTEAEWEKAARGTDGRLFPWGDQEPGLFLNGNFADESFRKVNPVWPHTMAGYDDGFTGTAPVESFPRDASPYGAHDMAGNTWEWVRDWYAEGYYASSPRVNPPGPSSGTLRVMRGGDWHGDGKTARCAERAANAPMEKLILIGFRCARDPAPPSVHRSLSP